MIIHALQKILWTLMY